MEQLPLVFAAVGLALFVGLIAFMSRLYRRSTSELSFVRTGQGGRRVVMNRGALVIPILHDLIWVNMNTLRLEVMRSKEEALITKDRMRVDVRAELPLALRMRWARQRENPRQADDSDHSNVHDDLVLQGWDVSHGIARRKTETTTYAYFGL